MIEIKYADPSEADQLTSICRASKKSWGYPEEWMKKWELELTITPEYIHRNRTLKIGEYEKTYGFSVIEKESNHWEIAHFWIIPNQQRSGLGAKLLEYILVHYVDKPIHVLADPNAQLFYQKFGFVAVKSVESAIPGRFLPLMIRTLSRLMG